MENENHNMYSSEGDHCCGDGAYYNSQDARYENTESVTEIRAPPERMQSTHSEVEAPVTINVAERQEYQEKLNSQERHQENLNSQERYQEKLNSQDRHEEKLNSQDRHEEKLHSQERQDNSSQYQSHARSVYRPTGLSTPWAVEMRANLPEIPRGNNHVRNYRSADNISSSGNVYNSEMRPDMKKNSYSATYIQAAGKPTLRDGAPRPIPSFGRKQLSMRHLSLDYSTPWATNRQEVAQTKVRNQRLKQRAEITQNKKKEGSPKSEKETKTETRKPQQTQETREEPNYPQESQEPDRTPVATEEPQQAYYPEPTEPDPPNYREIVSTLQGNYQECLSRLNRMPLCKDNLKLRQERRNLEFQLGKLEDQIRYASRLESQLSRHQ